MIEDARMICVWKHMSPWHINARQILVLSRTDLILYLEATPIDNLLGFAL